MIEEQAAVDYECMIGEEICAMKIRAFLGLVHSLVRVLLPWEFSRLVGAYDERSGGGRARA